MNRTTLAFIALAFAAPVQAANRVPDPYPLSGAWTPALEHISADSMKGHLSFLASDLLEGRNTPSLGLDIAAEYIAAQFRRAGLEPIDKSGYFQAATLDIAGKPVSAKNVAGILRGSDPQLSDTYIVVSAHYDHLGMLPSGDGDRVYNGANDDGSGTVSVIEIASALAASPMKPHRSILFVTFFGEEEGLLGSKYFVEHPLVPVDRIVAQVNLEQLGRTDDPAGPQIRRLGVTGFRYSDVGQILQSAGSRTGVKVHGDNLEPDEYFERSDNLPFATAGIPAHTVGAAFEFPDYHKPSDEWQKIDFGNMAALDRTIAAAVVMMADSPARPHWLTDTRGGDRYARQATKQSHEQSTQ